MQFHLVHIIPDPKLHGLYGYSEVIETVAWGLTRLGHNVTLDRNTFAQGRTNIVFGAQLLADEIIEALHPDTIMYNFEQLRGHSPSECRPSYAAAARRLRIWDYTPLNTDFWNQLSPQRPPVIVPVGYAPILRRIQKPKVQDIDVLFYGISGPLRLSIIDKLVNACLRTMYVSGLYGKARDELIARSKIVLNLNMYERSKIFEIVRVSYLLANCKAVVSDLYPESQIDADMREAVVATEPDKIVEACLDLLRDDDKRQTIEIRGQAIMMKRDIAAILRTALAAS